MTDALAHIAPLSTPEGDLPLYRLSVAQYHALIAAGVLPADASIELVEGILIHKMPKHEPHIFLVEQLRDWLLSLRLEGLLIRTEGVITLADSAPEPDVFIARGTREMYRARGAHPRADEVLFVAEVSDATLSLDRGRKLRAYARAGIPVYWIINLNDESIELHSAPHPPEERYVQRVVFHRGESVPLEIDGRVVGAAWVSDLFG